MSFLSALAGQSLKAARYVSVATLVLCSLVAVWFGIAGYQERGTVRSIRDVPRFGPLLKDLRTKGPVEYKIAYIRGATCTIRCRTSYSAVQEFCAQHGFVMSSRESSLINRMCFPSGSAGPDELFRDGDVLFGGVHRATGNVDGAFRKSDGWTVLRCMASERPADIGSR
jgi:hypothetical protein